jgi:hypothetical protein
MTTLRSLFAAGCAAFALAPMAAQAASVTVPFPEAGSVWVSATNGSGVLAAGGQTGYMWTTGDHVVDFFAGTGLGSATSLSGSVTIQNVLGGGNNQTVDILLNGAFVGAFTAFDSGYSGAYQTLNFSASGFSVAGPDYGLEFLLDNTIPGGGGSIAFVDGGRVTLTGGVPEPATWALMIGGFGLAGAALRRRALVAA